MRYGVGSGKFKSRSAALKKGGRALERRIIKLIPFGAEGPRSDPVQISGNYLDPD